MAAFPFDDAYRACMFDRSHVEKRLHIIFVPFGSPSRFAFACMVLLDSKLLAHLYTCNVASANPARSNADMRARCQHPQIARDKAKIFDAVPLW